MAVTKRVPARGRLLIVDDDEDVLQMMQDVMERHGYEVIAVDSGADALALIAHDIVPELILLDLEMDDINGWEVLSTLERHPRFGQFRVVVVSGASGRVPKWAGHLRKPFKIQALEQLLAQDH
jgi:CheY-like chemotaxis protein